MYILQNSPRIKDLTWTFIDYTKTSFIQHRNNYCFFLLWWYEKLNESLLWMCSYDSWCCHERNISSPSPRTVRSATLKPMQSRRFVKATIYQDVSLIILASWIWHPPPPNHTIKLDTQITGWFTCRPWGQPSIPDILQWGLFHTTSFSGPGSHLYRLYGWNWLPTLALP